VLGYFVLLATFGGVSAYMIDRMRQLGRDLRFVRTTYLEIALRAAQLRSLQNGIVDYLEQPTPRRPYVARSYDFRRRLLEPSLAQLRTLDAVPASHRRAVVAIEGRINGFLVAFDESDQLLEEALGRQGDAETQRLALKRLTDSERRLAGQIGAWFDELRSATLVTTTALERAERRARFSAIGLMAGSGAVGLLVILFGLVTLRPLHRLRDGVRHVARGEYRERVAVTGGTEVAELAREFNAMAAAIEEREQQLVRSTRLAAVGKMAAVITHEVRNPLSSIGLNAELLEEEVRELAPDSEAVALSQAIQKEVDRLTAITEEYLRFARLPRPRLDRESVNAIVSGLVEFQREELATRKIVVETVLAEGLPAIPADEAQIRQALLNLMRNAADAMSAGGGTLRLTTTAGAGDVVVIRVADTGPGIAEAHLARIFEPFFSTKEKGTGLGLALTQQIIAEHGGRIEVESRVGAGTTFTVTLPMAAAREEGART
jgi:two-component system, NtrC family, sensor kinase